MKKLILKQTAHHMFPSSYFSCDCALNNLVEFYLQNIFKNTLAEKANVLKLKVLRHLEPVAG